MFDAVNVDAIPRRAPHVAGYVDGYDNVAALRKRFPKAIVTTISVDGNEADVLDVEKGAASVASAPAWVKRMRALGRRPIVYISLASWQTIQAEFRTQKVDEPFWWIADWTNKRHLINGTVATQWISKQWEFDVSRVAKDFPRPTRPSLIKRVLNKLSYIPAA